MVRPVCLASASTGLPLWVFVDRYRPMLAIDHVQIAAPSGCEEAARVFFGKLLGLPERSKEGETRASGGVWFRTGSIELHVGVQDNFLPATKAHVALRTADEHALERLADRLAAAGYPVSWDGRLPGVRRFFTTDPWGNRMELMALLPS